MANAQLDEILARKAADMEKSRGELKAQGLPAPVPAYGYWSNERPARTEDEMYSQFSRMNTRDQAFWGPILANRATADSIEDLRPDIDQPEGRGMVTDWNDVEMLDYRNEAIKRADTMIKKFNAGDPKAREAVHDLEEAQGAKFLSQGKIDINTAMDLMTYAYHQVLRENLEDEKLSPEQRQRMEESANFDMAGRYVPDLSAATSDRPTADSGYTP